jgi:uncharacterized surface protein with fasciclin (FAS1) repeats
MRHAQVAALAGVALLAMGATAAAQAPSPAADSPDEAAQNPLVGGAVMYPSQDIIHNALNSRDHTTLVAAVKAAGLVETLEGPGPFTVFAPTNDAFAKLPPGEVDRLMKPENKAALVRVLTYHVVPGRWTTARIRSATIAGGGSAVLTTVEGEPIIATMSEGRIQLIDAKGMVAWISIGNVQQSNGLIHVIGAVLAP